MTTPAAMQNAYGIICDALMDAGKLRSGDEPDSETLALNTRRLNKLINFYMTQGLKLWLTYQLVLDLVPPLSNGFGVPLYTLGPAGTVPMQKPLRVISAFYVYYEGGAAALATDSGQVITTDAGFIITSDTASSIAANSNQYPLVCLSYPDEYERLSNLLQPGPVNSYAVDKQQNTLNVYLWNPPDVFTVSNGYVLLMIEQSVTNFVGITDLMNFPIEWSLALEWGLADLASVGQPASVIARCSGMAKLYKEALEDWDVEDADTMFQPDQRSYQNQGRFK
jgi:hypothetical protein